MTKYHNKQLGCSMCTKLSIPTHTHAHDISQKEHACRHFCDFYAYACVCSLSDYQWIYLSCFIQHLSINYIERESRAPSNWLANVVDRHNSYIPFIGFRHASAYIHEIAEIEVMQPTQKWDVSQFILLI